MWLAQRHPRFRDVRDRLVRRALCADDVYAFAVGMSGKMLSGIDPDAAQSLLHRFYTSQVLPRLSDPETLPAQEYAAQRAFGFIIEQRWNLRRAELWHAVDGSTYASPHEDVSLPDKG